MAVDLDSLDPDPGALPPVETLYALGECAAAAYGVFGGFPVRVRAAEYESFRDDDSGEFAYGASTASNVLVAFRGTEFDDEGDLATDLDTKLEDFCGGQAHRGIARSFRHIWTELGLEAWLRGQLADGSRRLWIVGHSLGGGLANLMLCELALSSSAPSAERLALAVTLGQPRVMDGALRDRLHAAIDPARFQRCDLHRDPIPCLPRRKRGFEHGGSCRFWHPYTLNWRTPKEAERALSVDDRLAEHNLGNYLKHLERWVEIASKG